MTEEQDRQKLIVRQNSVTNAVKYFEGEKQVGIKEILKVAEQFENWVFRTAPTKEEPLKEDPLND